MDQNSDDRRPEEEEAQETGGEDFELQLDDLDDEIIDLVDPVEDEDPASDDPFSSQDDEDGEDELDLGELDLEVDLGEKESAAVEETVEEETSAAQEETADSAADRKSTRLNSSH